MPFKWYFNRGSFFRGLPLFKKVVCFLEKGSMLFGKGSYALFRDELR